MDNNVIAAMARWPDVPDVFGWLSLTERGDWRLHTKGEALKTDSTTGQAVSEGESISSQSINQFINRNYEQDDRHQWYFQNGPQRVYVRLDAAPFVFHTADHELRHPVFVTHNGLQTTQLKRWCLDDAGHLYAETDLGAGLIAGRDLEQVLDQLTTADGASLPDALEHLQTEFPATVDVRWRDGSIAPLQVCHRHEVPDLLGFVRYPQPQA